MSRIDDIEKTIKELEHRIKYSKNPMEQRNLRQQVGQLQRELRLRKKAQGKGK